jgi:vitamin B12 transport system substrate-binding protein
MPAFLRQCFIPLCFWAVSLCVFGESARAQGIELIDGSGRAVILKEPARRVVTLSSQVTEIAFAAGGGSKIVATVNSSDFPAEALKLPRIGESLQPDYDKIASYRPDLIISQLSTQVDPLEELNVPLFISAPESLAEIADSVETFGALLGTSNIARPRADLLRQTLDMLIHANASRSPQHRPVRVFIQAGSEPDLTLSGDHLLSDVIDLCGGLNVFAQERSLTPKISPSEVVAAKPDIVLVGRSGAGSVPVADPQALAYWKSVGLPAARNGQVFMMEADVLFRPGPRLIEAAGSLCAAIDRAHQ